MQMENSIPNFRERELEAGIPGIDWEWEFPLTPGTCTMQYAVSKRSFQYTTYFVTHYIYIEVNVTFTFSLLYITLNCAELKQATCVDEITFTFTFAFTFAFHFHFVSENIELCQAELKQTSL